MKDDTKRKYADAFMELLKANSYNKISVNDICTKCDTFRANFYYHFKSKDALAEWIFDQDFAEMTQNTDDTVSTQTALLERMQAHRIFYLKSLARSAYTPIYYCLKNSIAAYLVRMQRLEDTDMDAADRFKVDYIASGWIGTVHLWLNGDFAMPPEQLSAFLYEKMLHAGLNRKE